MVDGRVFLVTGAAGGLARGVVPAFRAAGARLALADLQGAALEPGPDDTVHHADLSDFAAAEALVAEVRAAHGRVDGLVHLVGGFTWGPATAITPADYDRMIGLNLRTLVSAVRAVLPGLHDQGSGFVAGVASGQAWRGGAAGVALYAASKAAVAAFLRSVDAELGGTDVAVCALFPMGVIDTAANRAAMPDADPAGWIDPAGLGEALVFAASRGRRARLLELPVHGGR